MTTLSAIHVNPDKQEPLRSLLISDRRTDRVLFHIPATSDGRVSLEVASALLLADSMKHNKALADYKVFVETSDAECVPLFNAVLKLKEMHSVSSARVTSQKASQGYITPYRTTKRQKQVLALVELGYGNKDIGRELGIGLRTVKFHVSSLLKLFGATSRGELTYLLNHGYRAGDEDLKHSLKLPEGEPDAKSNEDSSRLAG